MGVRRIQGGRYLTLAIVVGAACGPELQSSNDGAALGAEDGRVDTGRAQGGPENAGSDAALGPFPAPLGCSDLFRQDTLQVYQVELSSDEWDRLEHELMNGPSTGLDHPYHPCNVRVGTEVFEGAMIRLKGQSSWRHTVLYDANPKAQFVVAFDGIDPEATFHGVKKLVFDMPRTDLTFMRERLAWAAVADMGVPALCANNARLFINGSYYGLYVAMEKMGGRVLKRLFPDASGGPLWKTGRQIDANEEAANEDRLDALWAASDMTEIGPLVWVSGTLAEWAAEIVINDGDGYYGGAHNFFVYDHPARGFVWLPHDLDSTFVSADDHQHPLFWWKARSGPAPRHHWVAALADARTRHRLVEAVQTALSRYDVDKMERRLDAWQTQIQAAVAEDPHVAISQSQHKAALKDLRDSFSARAEYLRSWLDCEQSGGADEDGDGLPWCEDCDDHSSSVGGVDVGCL